MPPSTMRALLLETYGDDLLSAIEGLRVVERPLPEPGRGEVLVKIDAAACNPSDLLLLQQQYGRLKTLPTVPGWEGTGTVIASGGGMMGWWLNGKRVACGLQEDRDGTWAEYVVAKATSCIPLRDAIPVEQAAGLIINPMTAVGLLETARSNGHEAAVHTAGASQVGRMLLRLAAEKEFPLINMVRRGEQVELLKSLGAKHVLNTSDEDFVDQLNNLAARLNATTAFEAIGGEMTGIVLGALPAGSTVYVYGALSEEDCSRIDPIEIIFNEKRVCGFYLGAWLQQLGLLGIVRASRRVQRLLIEKQIETQVQRSVSLDDAVDGLKQYVGNMSAGKVLIRPGQRT